LSQDRHTDVDAIFLHDGGKVGDSRFMGAKALRSVAIHEMPAKDFLTAAYRSEILDDVATLLCRLRVRHRLTVTGAYLKNDGFWSVKWTVRLPRYECHRLLEDGLVTQNRKQERLRFGL